MGSRRTHFSRLLLWIVLLVLAVRPVAVVERGFALATSPLRLLSELARPASWLGGRRALAADARFFERGEADLAEVEALWDDLSSLARPDRAELVRGRDLVPAEVIGRVLGDRDRLRVRVADPRGIERGLPVVHGETYVGRVVEVRGTDVEVRLVTSPRFAVGARLVAENDIWMTVGGLADDLGARSEPGPLALAVRSPSDREPPDGPVEVFELLADVDPRGELARGYSLGRLSRETGEPRVLADVDYGAGLYHVFLLAPEGARAGATDELALAVADMDWRPTRVLVRRGPTAWRAGLVVSRGTRDGVRVGAAVIHGLRLVGRVERAGLWSSDVRCLADPGLSVVAVARIAGDPVPRVLGRLVSSGRQPDDPSRIAFLWKVVVPVELPADGREVTAELFTGSGEPGVPGGLYLGEARLEMRGPDGTPRVLLVHEEDPAGELWVRSRGAMDP